MSEITRYHEAFCQHSLVLKGNTPRTIEWLQETLRLFLKETNVQSLSEIDQFLIEEYMIRSQSEKSWSPKTIRTRISALKVLLDWCEKRRLIPESRYR